MALDLNHLIFHQQASLMRAGAARGRKDFAAHQIEAAYYAARIRALRATMGATGRMTFAAA